jgi:chorismate mutase
VRAFSDLRQSFPALLLLAVGCGSPSPAPPAPAQTQSSETITVSREDETPAAVKKLLRLMRDRLSLMHEVARSKWNAKRPVADPERERALLREMEQKGREVGLDAAFTRAFFAAQIAAARLIQEADLDRWRAEGRPAFRDSPDLSALREKIDGLNRELLAALVEVRPELGDARTREHLGRWAEESLTGQGITAEARAAAVAGLTRP